MWVVVHVCTGLALGSALPAPAWVLFPAALLLHAVLDLVPHWDYTRHRRRRVWALLDVGAAVAITAALGSTYGLSATVLLTGWISGLPDLDVVNEVLPLKTRRRLFPSHWRSFPHGSCRAAWGIPLQVALAGLSVLAVGLGGAAA